MMGFNERTGKFDFWYFLHDLDDFFTQHYIIRCVVLPIIGGSVGILIGLLLARPMVNALDAIFR